MLPREFFFRLFSILRVCGGLLSRIALRLTDLRKDIVHGGNADTLPAPDAFRVAHGAGSYQVQITESDPAIDGNWRHAMSSLTAAHILLEGLIPGQAYWVRVRGIGSAGAGVWTEPVNLIVD